MRIPHTSDVLSALAAAEAPCVSIYLPTHRAYPDRQQDCILYKNLVKRAEEALGRSHPGPPARDIAHRLHRLEADQDFWAHTLDGVAVLASPGRFDVFTLPRTMPERAEVGDSFHVEPLIRHVQSADRFHVLGLSRERVALFDGNRYELHPLDVPGLPLTLTEALGQETDERQHQYHTAGPSRAVGPGAPGRAAMIAHGQSARKDEILTDTHRFFRAVDRAVAGRVSEPSGLALIPAGIDENLAEFRAVTKNRFVTAEAIHGDWTNWSLNEIRERAWKVFEKQYLAQLARIREDYGTAAARARATQHLKEAAPAAARGRVGILLIDGKQTMPGSIDMATGELHPASPGDNAAGDMLDDLAEIGLKNGATVIVTDADQMPTDTGLAAIFRY